MSDPHDHDPDPAALVELQRAFGQQFVPAGTEQEGGEPGSATTPPDGGGEQPEPAPTEHEPVEDLVEDLVDDLVDDASPPPPIEFGVPDLVPDDDPADDAAELVIVEQEPLAEPEPEPAPPPLVRIDDYHGSTEVVEASASVSDTASAPGDRGSDAAALGPDGDSSDGEPAEPAEPAVVVIDDDELPDAVYVQGSLDESSGQPIVFIDDDITGDTVAPEVDRDARRGIEPRLRARRAAIKRAMGRRRLRYLVFGTIALLIGVAVLAVLGSGLFAIKEDRVTVYNAVYTDQAALDAVVDDLVGTPALRVDVDQVEADLEAIPWVEEATVRIGFPSTATIELRERQAMATYQGPDQRFRVLDRYGRVLDVLEGQALAYVLVVGPDPVDLEPGQFAPQGYVAAAELAKNLTSSIRGRVVWIDVTADGSQLSLLLDDGTEVRFGAARDLFNKLLRLETTLANNPDLEPGIIDVSTNEVTF